MEKDKHFKTRMLKHTEMLRAAAVEWMDVPPTPRVDDAVCLVDVWVQILSLERGEAPQDEDWDGWVEMISLWPRFYVNQIML